jgi:hypothetical protein
MERYNRRLVIDLLSKFPEDPSVVPDRSFGDAQLLFEAGLMALDKSMLVTASSMLDRAYELGAEAFGSYLRTDVVLAREAAGLLEKIEGALLDVRGMQR